MSTQRIKLHRIGLIIPIKKSITEGIQKFHKSEYKKLDFEMSNKAFLGICKFPDWIFVKMASHAQGLFLYCYEL